MDLRTIAKLALAEDAARSVGGAEASPADPEFESKHPRSGGGRFSQKFSNFVKPDILSDAPSSDPDAEYADVVARYTNPDGTKKPGWMKAPDGTPTLLTERQWVQVRTPSFKRWFGDWEAVGWQRFLDSAPVARASGQEFKNSTFAEIADQMEQDFQALGGKVANPEVGTVRLTNHGINDTMRKGIGRNKLAAFPHVPEVIRKGKVVKWDRRWKGRNYDTAVIAAPIAIGGRPFAAFVVVQRHQNGDNNFYLHEVAVVDEMKVRGFRPRLAVSGEVDSSPDFINSLSNLIYGVNPASVSKVVSPNGEPMVCYHATPEKFDTFDKGKIFSSNSATFLEGFYFSDRKPKTPWNVMEVFLNIRSPLELDIDKASFDTVGAQEIADAIHRAGSRHPDRDEYLVDNGIVEEDEAGGYEESLREWYAAHSDPDGLIVRNTQYDSHKDEFVAFEPNQIKSAVANSGAFSPAAASTLDSAPAPFDRRAFARFLATGETQP